MLRFDHLVHAVHGTPEEAAKQMQKRGFHTAIGGEHITWGTWNSLCYFDLSYIEFLAVQHEDKAKKADNPLVQETVVKLQDGEGMLQIAIRTAAIEELAVKFSKNGLHTIGPFEGKRMRKDGRLLEWKMLFVKQEKTDRNYLSLYSGMKRTKKEETTYVTSGRSMNIKTKYNKLKRFITQ